jgi:hypothetical protein
VRRLRAVVAVALALVALSLMLAACGDGDDGEASTSPAPSEAQNESTTPPSSGGLPPELLKCFADKGFDVQSPAEIHSAPPEVVQECFGALHGGGASP